MFPQLNLGLNFCTWANSVVLSQQKSRCNIATFGLDAIQHHCPGYVCSENAAYSVHGKWTMGTFGAGRLRPTLSLRNLKSNNAQGLKISCGHDTIRVRHYWRRFGGPEQSIFRSPGFEIGSR